MSDSANAPGSWDIQTARALYNIDRWGAKYFDINDAGHVVAKPLQDAGASVDITDVIEEAKGRGLKFPSVGHGCCISSVVLFQLIESPACASRPCGPPGCN